MYRIHPPLLENLPGVHAIPGWYGYSVEVDELDAVAILISNRMPSTLFARAWANRPRQHHPMTPWGWDWLSRPNIACEPKGRFTNSEHTRSRSNLSRGSSFPRFRCFWIVLTSSHQLPSIIINSSQVTPCSAAHVSYAAFASASISGAPASPHPHGRGRGRLGRCWISPAEAMPGPSASATGSWWPGSTRTSARIWLMRTRASPRSLRHIGSWWMGPRGPVRSC